VKKHEKISQRACQNGFNAFKIITSKRLLFGCFNPLWWKR